MARKATKQQLEVRRLRLSTSHMYGNKCYICQKPVKTGKNFLYHHLWYEKTDKIYADFKTQLSYAEYLCSEVKKNPKKFMLLCNGCHVDVNRKKYFTPDRFRRLQKVVKLSK